MDAQERSNLDQPGVWVDKGCKGKGNQAFFGVGSGLTVVEVGISVVQMWFEIG